jgi:phosphate transport system ATP-binding protein
MTAHADNMTARVSHYCAFFLAEENTPGHVVESGPTDIIFDAPIDARTSDYVHGRFGCPSAVAQSRVA